MSLVVINDLIRGDEIKAVDPHPVFHAEGNAACHCAIPPLRFFLHEGQTFRRRGFAIAVEAGGEHFRKDIEVRIRLPVHHAAGCGNVSRNVAPDYI